MSMVGRSVLWGVMVWIMVGLILGSNTAVACQSSEGRIGFPWGPVAPVAFTGIGQLHTVLVYEIENIEPGEPFSLHPVDSSQTVCVNNLCGYPTDYNVAFYRSGSPSDPLVESFDDPGPVEGVVPQDAEYALVWMRAGASAPLVGDVVPVDDKFSWTMGCS